jgi:hypothetical protein
MQIKVCGFECSRTTALLEAAKELCSVLELGEVTSLANADEMKGYGISNTPALVVDDELIFQGCAMSSEGIRTMLLKKGLIS